MSNILITGGLGFIGYSLALSLSKKNNIIIVDKKKPKNFQKIKKIRIYQFDCLNIEKLIRTMNLHKIDTIFHCAALISVLEGEKNPKKFYEINYKLTQKILDNLKFTYCNKFIFSSSAAIYGASKKSLTERSNKKPMNIYGETKLLSEKYIIRNSKKNNIRFAILRYFNVVGNYRNKIGVINSKINPLFKVLSNKILDKKKNFIIYGKNFKTKDGTAVRDYINIKDLVNINIKVFNYLKKNKKNLILNCGSGKGFSNFEIFNKFKNMSNSKINLLFHKKRKGETDKSISNNNFLKKKVKYFKFLSIDRGIRESLYWFKKNS